MYSKRCCTHIETNPARGVTFFGFVWSCHIKQTHGLNHVSLSYVAIPICSRHHGRFVCVTATSTFQSPQGTELQLFVSYCLCHTSKKQISRENPSIHPWMTSPQLRRLWCPSICHRLFGPGTEYVLQVITVAHLWVNCSQAGAYSIYLNLHTKRQNVTIYHRKCNMTSMNRNK